MLTPHHAHMFRVTAYGNFIHYRKALAFSPQGIISPFRAKYNTNANMMHYFCMCCVFCSKGEQAFLFHVCCITMCFPLTPKLCASRVTGLQGTTHTIDESARYGRDHPGVGICMMGIASQHTCLAERGKGSIRPKAQSPT